MKTRSALLLAASLLALAFAFQGSRGIWEPDEGFYTNVTLGMMNSGDMIVPRLNGEPFLDKPPLVYWGMAGGMDLLGRNEWGARFFHGLMFLVAALATGAAARRLSGPGPAGRRAGMLAAFVYATSFAPFVAGNILTPDMPLAAAAACLLASYLATLDDARWSGGSPFWWAAMGGAAGAGFLAKGPAILVFAAPLGLHAAIRIGRAALAPAAGRGRIGTIARGMAGPALAASLAVAIGSLWYGLVFLSVPGAFRYVLDNQVVGRLFTATYARNAAPLNLLIYYPPVVFLGALPWVLFLPDAFLRGVRNLRTQASAQPDTGGTAGGWMRAGLRALLSGSPGSAVVLAIVLPLAVLSAASSRLPLYALPLFGALVLVESRAVDSWLARARAAWRPRGHAWAAALLCLALVGVKAAGARVDRPNDTRVLAGLLSQRLARVPVPLEVVSVDTKRNALPFYGFTDFEWVTSHRDPYPFFTEPETLGIEIAEARRSPERHAFLVENRLEADVSRELREAGVRCSSGRIFEDESLILCEPGAPTVIAAGGPSGRARTPH